MGFWKKSQSFQWINKKPWSNKKTKNILRPKNWIDKKTEFALKSDLDLKTILSTIVKRESGEHRKSLKSDRFKENNKKQ